jgi:predicted AAA+ superfamily ATPase
MYERNLIKELTAWSNKANRKPLVLRGARQVGKTTIVNMFAQQFEQYIYLNLELADERLFFKRFDNFDDMIQAIFLAKNMNRSGKRTLLFIDEIQESPEAIKQLRYFYEQAPEIHVIAAGSRWAVSIKRDYGFPVGRVEYLSLRPVSFPEFLNAIGETEALKQLTVVPVTDFAHDKLLKMFHLYTLIGGMPEIVELYAKHRDLTMLRPVYESLIASYIDDIEKFARNQNQVEMIRHTIKAVFSEAGNRITFEGFGRSNYRSREMVETLRKLEKAFLIYLVYPSTQVNVPILQDRRKSPRLQLLDTGLLNYYNGLQIDLMGTDDLNKVYQGLIAQHIVGQELLAKQSGILSGIFFWVREKKESQAEVDYIYPYMGKVIPIEVKSGSSGKLKSLHLFMDKTSHQLAVRFYPGKVSDNLVKTPSGKDFTLLNMPYYLVSQIDQYLEWMFLKKSQNV